MSDAPSCSLVAIVVQVFAVRPAQKIIVKVAGKDRMNELICSR
jgi:hypothetical protein